MSWAEGKWEIVQTSTECKRGAEVRETMVGHPLCDSCDHGCETSIAAGTALFHLSRPLGPPASLGKSCSLSRDSVKLELCMWKTTRP